MYRLDLIAFCFSLLDLTGIIYDVVHRISWAHFHIVPGISGGEGG